MGYGTDQQRAHAAAQLEAFEDSFDTLRRARKPPSEAPFWKKEAMPYLDSATSGRQWPQTRVAGARHAAWTTDSRCQLCKEEEGTLIHRVHCRASKPQDGWPTPTGKALPYWNRMTNQQHELLLTRGIAAVRVQGAQAAADGTVQWVYKDMEDRDEDT